MYGFEYEIIDGEVTIKWLKDRSITSINIPEFIDGYPVTKISPFALDSSYLTVVNGSYVNNGLCVINNKFILYRGFTYKIKHNIGNDFTSNFRDRNNYRYFIDDILYDIDFKAVY